jgi:hypothetical protein
MKKAKPKITAKPKSKPTKSPKRVVRYDTMRGRIHIAPGAMDPIDEDRFLRGKF